MMPRVWTIIGLFALNLAAPATVRSADAQKLEKLVIGYPAPVASLGIVDVMRKGGLFKKNGLDVDLVYIQGSPILTTAMVSGQVPLSFIGGAAMWRRPSAAPIRFISPAVLTRSTGASFRRRTSKPSPISKARKSA